MWVSIKYNLQKKNAQESSIAINFIFAIILVYFVFFFFFQWSRIMIYSVDSTLFKMFPLLL